MGDFRCNRVVARALSDDDRGVRWIADQSIGNIWFRAGDAASQRWLAEIQRWNDAGAHEKARDLAAALCDRADDYAEAWNQWAVASYALEDLDAAIHGCQRVLVRNPLQFEAMIGLGHAFAEWGESELALEQYRSALSVHPYLEHVRLRVRQMEAAGF